MSKSKPAVKPKKRAVHIRFLATILIRWDILEPKKIEIKDYTLDDICKVIKATKPDCGDWWWSETVSILQEECLPILKEKFRDILDNVPTIEAIKDFEAWVKELEQTYGEYISVS